MTRPTTTVVVEPPPSSFIPSTMPSVFATAPVSTMLSARLAVLRPSAVISTVRPPESMPAKVRGFRTALKP